MIDVEEGLAHVEPAAHATAVQGDEHHGAVARVDGVGERGDLGGGQELLLADVLDVLGKPWHEVSAMRSTVDINAAVIADNPVAIAGDIMRA